MDWNEIVALLNVIKLSHDLGAPASNIRAAALRNLAEIEAHFTVAPAPAPIEEEETEHGA